MANHTDQQPRPCWFCGCDDPAPIRVCGFCNHRVDDGPTPDTRRIQAPQPATDDEARMRASQIIGPDIDHAWTGNWHQTLQAASAHWTPTQTDHTPAA